MRIREYKEWLKLDKYSNSSGVTIENIIFAYNEAIKENDIKKIDFIKKKYFNKIIHD